MFFRIECKRLKNEPRLSPSSRFAMTLYGPGLCAADDELVWCTWWCEDEVVEEVLAVV